MLEPVLFDCRPHSWERRVLYGSRTPSKCRRTLELLSIASVGLRKTLRNFVRGDSTATSRKIQHGNFAGTLETTYTENISAPLASHEKLRPSYCVPRPRPKSTFEFPTTTGIAKATIIVSGEYYENTFYRWHYHRLLSAISNLSRDNQRPIGSVNIIKYGTLFNFRRPMVFRRLWYLCLE